MDWFDRVIVGSGPAGVAAARKMDVRGTCLVDVGDTPHETFPFASLQDALSAGDSNALLGANWEMLSNLFCSDRIHPKLRASALRFVMSGEPVRVSNADGYEFNGAGSFAVGGMSNVWGAQLLRYTDDDLLEAGEWPFSISVLDSHYSDLEAHIGISGEIDDMYAFLGGLPPSMPPTPLCPAADYLYTQYLVRRNRDRKQVLLLGRPRLAIATRPYSGRPKHDFHETEFFASGQPGLYTAQITLRDLKTRGMITHLDRYKLLGWHELEDYVELDLCEMDSGLRRKIRTRQLLLGCGAVQTACLVLRHYGERGRKLPFLDHPPTLLPIFLPKMLGKKLPTKSYPIQLIGTLPMSGRRDMVSFYYPGGMLWSDLIPEIPLPINTASTMIGSLLGGMLIAQIWQTVRPSSHNQLELDDAGLALIRYPARAPCSALPEILSALRSLGAYSLSRLASYSPPGWGFHHAGSLPMRRAPREFETHTDGRLWNSCRVRVIDGSLFPSLPGKNHSLTLMANASRIADEVMKCAY